MAAIRAASRLLSLAPKLPPFSSGHPLPALLRCAGSGSRSRPFSGGGDGRGVRPRPAGPAPAGWFLGLGDKKNALPEIVKAGDPVLHEPAAEVAVGEIGTERVQKVIDDMVAVMREAPGVGLAAPQIGIPLRVGKDWIFFWFVLCTSFMLDCCLIDCVNGAMCVFFFQSKVMSVYMRFGSGKVRMV